MVFHASLLYLLIFYLTITCMFCVHIPSSGFNLINADTLLPSRSCNIISTPRFPKRSYGKECGSKNEIPELNWNIGPPGTQSYAITIIDTNVPACLQPNLIVWNISPTTFTMNAKTLLKDSAITIGENFRKTKNYSGPCPNAKDDFHCIKITIYALRQSLSPPIDASFSSFRASILLSSKKNEILSVASYWFVAVPMSFSGRSIK